MFAREEDLLKLAGLGGRPFEDLVIDLLREEGFTHGIPPHMIHWDHRTNMPDGGRDMVVEGHHDNENPRFVPQRPSIWSAKSGADGIRPARLRNELLADHHREVRQHLRDGNPYVWCILQPIDEDGRNALRLAVSEVAENAFSFNPELVEFRTLTDLRDVLNDHPGLIAKHLPDLAQRLEGVCNLAEWKREDRFAVDWVEFAQRRTVVEQLQNHLRATSPPNVLHLAGLSGVGKTRIVREACESAEDLHGTIYVARYADFSDKFSRHLTRNEHLVGRVVIDEFPLSEIGSFIARVQDFAKRLRFITIGPAQRDERSRPSSNILIIPEPQTEGGILSVVQKAGEDLAEAVVASIADYSGHDFRLALMLVEATKRDGEFRDLPIQDGDDVWNRVTRLFRNRITNFDSFRHQYPYLTLAIDVGVSKEHRNELELLADYFQIAIPRLDETVSDAVRCGLGIKTPNLFEATPRALAGHLFRHRIWGVIENTVKQFLDQLPDRLLRRFVERCHECVGPEREEMEVALADFFLKALSGSSLEDLADRRVSRLFKAWAELDPINGLAWLRAAVDKASDEELAALDGKSDGSGGWRGRRQIVWLCEHLACFGEYFQDCEEILFRLAQVETEPSIGNNSSAVWRDFFWPALSFTEVPFRERATILKRRLISAREETLPLIMSAVIGALGRPTMRLAPPTVVGGRLVPEPWRPANFKELRELQRRFAEEIFGVVEQLEPAVSDIVVASFIKNVRILIDLGFFGEVARLSNTASNSDELRRQLRLQLLEMISFREQSVNKTNESDPMLNELRKWAAELAPTDLAARIKELTRQDYWVTMRNSAKREKKNE